MTRKLVALILVVSMILCMFTGCASTQETSTTTIVQTSDLDISVVETEGKREASTTVEGVSLKCEHNFDTDEYWLYLEEEPIHLNVATFEDHIEVYMADEAVADYEEGVVGQLVLTLSLATPTFIAAAKTLLAIAAGYTVTTTVCVSADALGTVIGGIRSNSKVYTRLRTIDVPAADAIRFGRMKKTNTYYEAYLSGNTVMVSREISQWEAIIRLERGKDVFATSEFAAIYACLAATTNNNRGKDLIHHTTNKEGYYPHYHPLGRHWYKDYDSAPHCWYPYT